MMWFIIPGGILVALFLLCQIRIGALVDYGSAGLFLKLKFGPWFLSVLPSEEKPKKRKEKASKPAKQTQKTAQEQPKPKRSVKDTIALVRAFVPLVGEAAGHMMRKIRIDVLKIHVIWASSDPASAAMGYGAGNALLGMLWPVFEHNFKVKERDLRVDVDFERSTPVVTISARATLTIGQGLSLGFRLGIKACKIYLGFGRGGKQNIEKAVQA